MNPNETTGEELRGIRDVVHEANCTSNLEREGNKRGSTKTPQHKQAATTNCEAEENEVLWPHTTQMRHHLNHIRRENGGQKTER